VKEKKYYDLIDPFWVNWFGSKLIIFYLEKRVKSAIWKKCLGECPAFSRP